MIIKVWYWPSHCSPSCHVSWDTCDPVLTNIKIVQWNWAEWHCLTGDMGTDHCWPRYVTSPPGHNAHESTIDTEILVFACKTWQMIIHLTSLLYCFWVSGKSNILCITCLQCNSCFLCCNCTICVGWWLSVCIWCLSLCLRSLMSRSPAAVFTALSSVATHPPLWSHLSHLCTNTPVTNHTNMFWQQLETVKHVNMSCDQL